jgi:hypothetical protein
MPTMCGKSQQSPMSIAMHNMSAYRRACTRLPNTNKKGNQNGSQ